MGLDMYAYTYRATLVKTDDKVGDNLSPDKVLGLDYEDPDYRLMWGAARECGDYDPDFAYWRKFNHLHGWMENLYRVKGGTYTFNCEYLRLMPEDLDSLEQDAKHLEPTTGFFFGSYEPITDEEVQEVMDFVKKARQAIADGMAVVYTSWW